MKKAIFIFAAAMFAGVSYGQVASSSRTNPSIATETPVIQEKSNEPDSVTVMSSGRFSKPVKTAKPVSEEQLKAEPVKSSPARKPD